jgi:hypothetical protein
MQTIAVYCGPRRGVDELYPLALAVTRGSVRLVVASCGAGEIPLCRHCNIRIDNETTETIDLIADEPGDEEVIEGSDEDSDDDDDDEGGVAVDFTNATWTFTQAFVIAMQPTRHTEWECGNDSDIVNPGNTWPPPTRTRADDSGVLYTRTSAQGSLRITRGVGRRIVCPGVYTAEVATSRGGGAGLFRVSTVDKPHADIMYILEDTQCIDVCSDGERVCYCRDRGTGRSIDVTVVTRVNGQTLLHTTVPVSRRPPPGRSLLCSIAGGGTAVRGLVAMCDVGGRDAVAAASTHAVSPWRGRRFSELHDMVSPSRAGDFVDTAYLYFPDGPAVRARGYVVSPDLPSRVYSAPAVRLLGEGATALFSANGAIYGLRDSGHVAVVPGRFHVTPCRWNDRGEDMPWTGAGTSLRLELAQQPIDGVTVAWTRDLIALQTTHNAVPCVAVIWLIPGNAVPEILTRIGIDAGWTLSCLQIIRGAVYGVLTMGGAVRLTVTLLDGADPREHPLFGSPGAVMHLPRAGYVTLGLPTITGIAPGIESISMSATGSAVAVCLHGHMTTFFDLGGRPLGTKRARLDAARLVGDALVGGLVDRGTNRLAAVSLRFGTGAGGRGAIRYITPTGRNVIHWTLSLDGTVAIAWMDYDAVYKLVTVHVATGAILRVHNAVEPCRVGPVGPMPPENREDLVYDGISRVVCAPP